MLKPVGYKLLIQTNRAEIKLKKDEELYYDSTTKKYEVRLKSSILEMPAMEKYDEEDLFSGAEVGIVIAMGEDCYTDKAKKWCEVGDTVYFKRYSGFNYTKDGKNYILLNDDQVIAVETAEEY